MTTVTASNLGKEGNIPSTFEDKGLTCSHGETSHRLLLILWENPIIDIGTWWRYVPPRPHFLEITFWWICIDKQKAIITFERPSAARTALLLQDAHLGSSQVHVSSSVPFDEPHTPPSTDKSKADTDFSQEDKPRTAVFAGSYPLPSLSYFVYLCWCCL